MKWHFIFITLEASVRFSPGKLSEGLSHYYYVMSCEFKTMTSILDFVLYQLRSKSFYGNLATMSLFSKRKTFLRGLNRNRNYNLVFTISRRVIAAISGHWTSPCLYYLLHLCIINYNVVCDSGIQLDIWSSTEMSLQLIFMTIDLNRF